MSVFSDKGALNVNNVCSVGRKKVMTAYNWRVDTCSVKDVTLLLLLGTAPLLVIKMEKDKAVLLNIRHFQI